MNGIRGVAALICLGMLSLAQCETEAVAAMPQAGGQHAVLQNQTETGRQDRSTPAENTGQTKKPLTPLSPEVARARFRQGLEAYRARDYDRALSLWAPLRGHIPDRIWHADMAAALIGKGRLEDAATHLEVALEQDEAIAPLWRMLKSIRAHQARAAYAEVFKGNPPPAVYRQVLQPEWQMGSRLSRDSFMQVWRALEQWRKAWVRQDARQWLTFYSWDFKPDSGLSLKKWVQLHRRKLKAPRFIQVELNDITIRALPEGLIRTQFREHYRSDLSEHTLYKALDWAWTPEGWRIVRERVLR